MQLHCIVCSLLPPLAGCAAPCQHMLLVLGGVTRMQRYQTQIIIARLSLAVFISTQDEVENIDSCVCHSHKCYASKTEGHMFTER